MSTALSATMTITPRSLDRLNSTWGGILAELKTAHDIYGAIINR